MSDTWSDEFVRLCELTDRLMAQSVRLIDNAGAREMLRIAHDKGQTVTCSKGCSVCCRLNVTVSLPEVLSMLAHQSDIDTDAVDVQRRLVIDESTTNKSYFEGRYDCVFLRDGLCSVYDARPMTCRTHFVISPKDDCEGERSVKKLRTPRIDAHADASIQIARLLGIPMSYAPMPVIVGMALSVSESSKPKKELWEFARLHGMDELGKSARKWVRYR